jgi:hypothetical protein
VGFSAVVLAAAVAPGARAFQLDAEAAPEERRLLNVPYSRLAWLERKIAQYGAPLLFSDPIHEELTTRMFGCDGDVALCGGANSISADPAVLVGVRWNDDPPFRLTNAELDGTRCKAQTIRFQTQPSCWLQLFKSAEKKAAAGKVYGPKDGLLYRTHFGDLQFLHGMASGEDIAPAETQQRMMDWAQFTWRVATREWPKTMKMRDVPLESFKAPFGYTEWDVRDLFIQGSPLLERRVDQVAFGSLLHMLQDSFAEGHVEREQPNPDGRCQLAGESHRAPGQIREFHAYGRQDHAAHAAADSKEAKDRQLQRAPDVVDVGRPLVEAFDARRPWSEVEPYFACVFALAPDAKDSSAGETFAAAP